MSVIIQGTQLRTIELGTQVTKATGTLTAATLPLFTVAGGIVAVTSLVGKVTTSITVANSYKVQMNPTAGDTADLCAATDIGTTDTLAGDVLGFDGTPTSSIVKYAGLHRPLFLPVGQIEHVSAGTDGAITWYLTYIPIDSGATVVAA